MNFCLQKKSVVVAPNIQNPSEIQERLAFDDGEWNISLRTQSTVVLKIKSSGRTSVNCVRAARIVPISRGFFDTIIGNEFEYGLPTSVLKAGLV